ncbi:MAG: hypothetical protein FWE35_01030 [Streptosporangiales bacterium]|nr:hypothetical protein [Streptosporangiales bacterium]
MRQPVRSGRARIPAEWRHAIMLPWYRRAAIIAVAGAATREAAADVLAGHLPMVSVPEPGPDLDFGPEDVPDPDDDGGPDPAAVLEDSGHAEDTESARRIARALGSFRSGKGTRELLTARAINPTQPAVYAWRRAAPGEYVYRLWPNGDCRAAAVFGQEQVPARSGHVRPRLTARRYT